MEKTVEQVRQQVIDTFRGSMVEATSSILSTWVVAFTRDALPLKTDGNKIAIYGETIFSTHDKQAAKAVAKNINEQLGESGTVQPERSGAWRKRRVQQLYTFIAQVTPIDDIVSRRTCSDTLEALANAAGNYRPTIRCTRESNPKASCQELAELMVLADAYDRFQEQRGDARRAYRG